VRIPKDFKLNEFVSADFRGVMGVFCGSADAKGVRGKEGISEKESGISERMEQSRIAPSKPGASSLELRVGKKEQVPGIRRGCDAKKVGVEYVAVP